MSDVAYKRCYCKKGKWIRGCPLGLTHVLACPPKKPEKGIFCCASINRKNLNQKLEKKGMNRGPIERILRVFDG